MTDEYLPKIEGTINAKNIILGKGVIVEEGVLITGNHGEAECVTLGDFCFIGRHTRILVPEFKLGDYSKLHSYSFAHGEKPMQIGRNCWIGGNCVLDSLGGLDIDDNVGIGAQSQIWTHIQFGDIVEGSRFFTRKYMHIGKDAWFVGHCIVSPVNVGEKSMALVGSVVTQDMLPNHIYAGVPAKDMSDKFGYQFEDRSLEQKATKLKEILDSFLSIHPEYIGQYKIITNTQDFDDNICCFDVSNRTYNKTYRPAEVAFLKANVPLVKFIPRSEPEFIKIHY